MPLNMQKGCIWWRERKKKRERVKDRERSQTKLDKQWKKIEALMRNSIGRCNAKSEFISKFYRNALEWTFARLQGKKMPLWRIYLHLFSELCVCFGSEVFSNSLATQMQLSRNAIVGWRFSHGCTKFLAVIDNQNTYRQNNEEFTIDVILCIGCHLI